MQYYYDEEAHQFLADRYIIGECPPAMQKEPTVTNARVRCEHLFLQPT